jgi:hypothetical protein
LISFLEQLRWHFRGERVLRWDGLMSHRSRTMHAYLQTQRRWPRVERLPGYAPELNRSKVLEPPQEWTGRQRRRGDHRDGHRVGDRGHPKAQSNQQLIFGFRGQTGLALWSNTST